MEEIKLIKKSELSKVLEFNAKEYGPKHILANKTYYDWQFSNHLNTGDCYTSWGIFSKKNAQLLGSFGYFEADYDFFGKKIRANCLCNLIVREDLRSMGFGYLLLKQATALNDIAIDYAIKKDIWPLFEKTGWHGENLKRFFYVIDPLKTSQLTGGLVGVTASPRPYVMKNSNWSFEKIKVADYSIDDLWNRIGHNYPITIVRDSSYINWRYLRHPLLNYNVFTAKEGKVVKALAVLRLEKPKPYSLVHVVDLIAEDNLSAKYILIKSIEHCIKNKVDWLDYFFSGQFYLSELEQLGFFNGDRNPYDHMPLLFNPIDRIKRTTINFAVKLINKNLSRLGDWETLDKWYTTKGGGDQDRPN